MLLVPALALVWLINGGKYKDQTTGKTWWNHCTHFSSKRSFDTETLSTRVTRALVSTPTPNATSIANTERKTCLERLAWRVAVMKSPNTSTPLQTSTSQSKMESLAAVGLDMSLSRQMLRLRGLEEEILLLPSEAQSQTLSGLQTNLEWVANLMSSLTPARLEPHNTRNDVKVESGFLSLYTSDESQSKFGLGSCREQLLSEVSRLLNRYKGEKLSITLAGHSMGSSMALLLGYDIAELGLNRDNSGTKTPITVFSFGGPRVGNLRFKQRCEELGVKVLRIVNVNDPFTKMPGVVFNHENFKVLGGEGSFEFPWSCSCYAHVGFELVLDFFNMQNPSCVHDLGTYISLLKCPKRVQIQKEGADLMNMARDLLLKVNMSAQNLKMQLPIPWRSVSSSRTRNMVNHQVQTHRT